MPSYGSEMAGKNIFWLLLDSIDGAVELASLRNKVQNFVARHIPIPQYLAFFFMKKAFLKRLCRA